MADRNPTLRAVGPDETPGDAPSKSGSATVAGATTTRELLVAMRTRIAKAIDDPKTPARDLAALTKRIGEVVRDIDALDARQAEDDAPRKAVDDGEFDASAV